MTAANAVTTSAHFGEITELLDQGLSHSQVHATLVEHLIHIEEQRIVRAWRSSR